MEYIKSLITSIFSDVGVYDAIRVTLIMAVCSTALSTVLGVFFGLLLERTQFTGKRLIIRINRTLMGIPPVVVGLAVYLLIMRRGLWGDFPCCLPSGE